MINYYRKKKQKGKKNGRPTLALINNKIEYGAQYLCLVAMNVRGGKVLLPTLKYLAREELRPKEEDAKIVYTNYNGGMFSEIWKDTQKNEWSKKKISKAMQN